MEEETKMSFWKKIKTSIWGLEDYKKLALQKISKTVGYLAILMLIFSAILSTAITYISGKQINEAKKYINEEIEEINFENGELFIKPKEGEIIDLEDNENFSYKLIVNTNSKEEEKSYIEKIKEYSTGIVILQDKVILKTGMLTIPTTLSLKDIANQYNIVKVTKQNIIDLLSGKQLLTVYFSIFMSMFMYLFIIMLSTTLIDALMYSLLAYITSMISRINLKYSACYNIAIHALTLPIILNVIYMVVNILTGFTIKYFDIMYMAITCIYIIASIMIIKSDLIKKQMELSKVIVEQEKVRQEIEKQEQEEEKSHREREKEEQRKKEKKTTDDKETKKGDGAQPEANIK